MKYILAISLLGIVHSSLGQEFKPITFDSLRQYSITHEDSLADIWDGMNDHEYVAVNADLTAPSRWGPTPIHFAEANLRGDTLQIEFQGYSRMITVATFRILIVRDQYWSHYNFKDDFVEGFVSNMIPIETKLILNDRNCKRGTTVKGYAEYKGKCRNCKRIKIIEFKGSFKALIK